MYKLMINDTFITNVYTFNESLTKDGPITLSFLEELRAEDVPRAEDLLLNLQPYAQDNAIQNIKVLTQDDIVIFETTFFSSLDSAVLTFNESSSLHLNIVLQ